MPKLIDHDIKKMDIAQATRKVIVREGVGGASVRNIAKEAGITLGALRYYFVSQEELLAYTEELIHETVSEKAAEHFMGDLPPRTKILELLMGLLPEEDNEECAAKARMVFKLQPNYFERLYDTAQDSVFQAVKSVMSNLVMLNLLKKDTDLSVETERLYALMDGLAINLMLRGEGNRREKARRILETHLNSICREEIGDQY